MLGCGVLLVLLFPQLGAAMFCFAAPLALLGLATVSLVPVLITAQALSITTQHLQDNPDELLLLTNLSSVDILWAFIAAPLYRWRHLLRLTTGLMPAIVVSLSITLVIVQIDFDGLYWCVDLPLGARYCNMPDEDEDATSGKQSNWPTQLIAAVVCAPIGIIGINLLAAVAGTCIAYCTRNRLVASISAVVMFSITAIVWTLLFIELAYSVLGTAPADTSRIAFYSTLFGSVPYILALGLGRFCQRRVRRPS
jgi:hypothetical protein